MILSEATMEGQDGPDQRNAASLKRDDNDEDAHPDMIPSINVEQEDGENASLVVPPDVADLSPIHKILVIDLWSDNSKVVEKAMTELADLCELLVANREVVHKAGGAVLIVGAMRKWYNNPDMQVQGCLALENAAATSIQIHDASMKAFHLAAKEVGAFEVVVSTMKNYPDNRLIQLHGCAACANLCCYLEENVNHFVNNTINGLDRILAAMRKFPDDALVQHNACWVLMELSDQYEFRARIGDLGGYRALGEAIDTHKDETEEHVKELQEYARTALKNLL